MNDILRFSTIMRALEEIYFFLPPISARTDIMLKKTLITFSNKIDEISTNK